MARQQLLEAAMAILQATPGQKLNIVVLNKALFYLDLRALLDHGHTVTSQPYIALPQGPTVASYQRRLVRDLANEGYARQVTSGAAKPIEVIKPLAAFDRLSPDELRLAREVATWISKFNSSEASDYSHENVGWKLAYERGVKRGKPAAEINMRIALQQLADDEDGWLKDPIDAELAGAASRAGESTTEWK